MSGPDFTVLDDLNEWRARLEQRGPVTESGGGLRCPCPIHGGDNKSALSVTRPNGKVIVKCWTNGCHYTDVRAELFPELEVIEEREDEIRDIDGKVVAIHRRTKYGSGVKSVWWERSGGAKGLGGIRVDALPLYGTHLLASRPNEPAVITEGEKAAEALEKRGIIAVGTVTGAEKCPSVEALSVLRGRDVILWPDRDAPGRAHMDALGARLRGIADHVTVFDWAEAPSKGDAADWRGSTEDLETALRAAPEWKLETPAGEIPLGDKPVRVHVPATQPEGEHLTDLGNRDRLVRLHGRDIRYATGLGWHVFTGTHWSRDEEGAIRERAVDVVRTMYAEAAALPDKDARTALVRHAERSEGEARLRAMVELAKTHPDVRAAPEDFDADGWILNCASGTVDLRTGELRPHSREDLCTRISPVEYDPDARSSVWESFLERVLPDSDVRAFVQRLAGYSSSGDTSEQCFSLLHGVGANGKTTLVEPVAAALGTYAQTTPFDTFLERRPGGTTNDLAALAGARLVCASEPDAGVRLSSSVVKQVTGGERITCRFLYREHFTYRPTFKVWLIGNHRPRIRDTSLGMWRRVRLIAFDVVLPEEEQDRDLPRKLGDHLPAVLAWVVRGCLDAQREGLRAPRAVLMATEEYRQEEDHVGRFIAEACVESDGMACTARVLRENYERWCSEEGEEPVSNKKLGQRLTERGHMRTQRGSGRARTWLGIGPAPRNGG